MRYRTKHSAFKTRASKSLLLAAGVESVHEAIPQYVAGLRQKAITRGLEGAAVPPYDPNALAQVLGVYDVRRKNLDCDGRIVRKGYGLTIELNKQTEQSRRIRFTFAHEVGHVILWDCAGAVRSLPARRHSGPSEIERLCDMLASEILAPEADVRRMFH